MKVVHQTDAVLQLEHFPTPWVIGLGTVLGVLLMALVKALVEFEFGGMAIASLMILAIGWVWLTRIFRRLQILLNRDTNVLRISVTTPLGEQGTDYPLTELTRAEVQTRHDSNSVAEPRLVLVLGNAEPPRRLWPDPFKPDAADLLQVSERINAWLASGSAPEHSTKSERGDVSP